MKAANEKEIDNIIIVILGVISLSTIIVSVVLHYDLSLRNYLAFAGLATVGFSKVLKGKKTKTILGIVLIVGSINALIFTYFDFYFVFNFSVGNLIDLSILGIQPLSLILLLILVSTHWQETKAAIKKILMPSPEEIKDNKEDIIKTFKKRYQTKSDAELYYMLENRKEFSDEAILAVEELMHSRTDQENE